jgi:hypothetical protein
MRQRRTHWCTWDPAAQVRSWRRAQSVHAHLAAQSHPIAFCTHVIRRGPPRAFERARPRLNWWGVRDARPRGSGGRSGWLDQVFFAAVSPVDSALSSGAFGFCVAFFFFFLRERGAPIPRRTAGSQSLDSVWGALPGPTWRTFAPQQYDFGQAETHVFLNRTAHDFRLVQARGGGIEGYRQVQSQGLSYCTIGVKSMACIVTGVSRTDWAWTAVPY